MSVQWYQLSAEAALQEMGSASDGLSAGEATRRLEQYGANELREKAHRTKWQILLDQFKGILTVLLIVAALVSAFLGDWIEAVAILIIVVLNGVLGYTQESRAEQSMEALKRMSVPIVRVRRDGQLREISARDLVPGDIVILETGNI
ncbi:MAG TPA: cation-transporting P-type ATPase, partial [Promineifilum sp.]|nr:cation-transporting P-type ATPase [Promineifilum sp.]